MNIPAQLKYTREHEWVDVDGDTVLIGITDWAQSELGDIVFVELPGVGDSVKIGEAFGTIEAVKAVSELYSPVTGKVVEVNSDLEDDPMLVNRSPFEKAWMVKIQLSDLAELDKLLSVQQYSELID